MFSPSEKSHNGRRVSTGGKDLQCGERVLMVLQSESPQPKVEVKEAVGAL